MDDIEHQLTKIDPIPEGIERPFWSVMIPTYNCREFLKQTLQSVIAQDPGQRSMQIEVIDDFSSDDPKSVVDEIGKGRVSFYQHPQNLGPTHTFNTCVKRSIGHWVHILHGDDLVEPVFYERMSKLAHKYPQAGLLAARSFEIDEYGELISLSPRFQTLENYTFDASPFFYVNPFRTPSMVISRNFYETHGGFNLNLVHVADWELWIRAISTSGGVGINQPLSQYRIFSSNHTSTLMKTGKNLDDYLMFAKILQKQFSNFDLAKFKKMVSEKARQQLEIFRSSNDLDAVRRNYKIWWQNSKFENKIYWIIKDIKYFMNFTEH